MNALDLFAGPGGWDFAAESLGIDVLGVELDDAAVATRDAAGLSTVHADVASLDPLDFGPVDGLIASPPCQAFPPVPTHQAFETGVAAAHELTLSGEIAPWRSLLDALPDRAGSSHYAGPGASKYPVRRMDEPAPTIAFGHDSARCGFATGGRARATSPADRIQVGEAGVLRSFPRSYPWRGPITKRYEQVGNAIPPMLAKAILSAVIA